MTNPRPQDNPYIVAPGGEPEPAPVTPPPAEGGAGVTGGKPPQGPETTEGEPEQE